MKTESPLTACSDSDAATLLCRVGVRPPPGGMPPEEIATLLSVPVATIGWDSGTFFSAERSTINNEDSIGPTPKQFSGGRFCGAFGEDQMLALTRRYTLPQPPDGPKR